MVRAANVIGARLEGMNREANWKNDAKIQTSKPCSNWSWEPYSHSCSQIQLADNVDFGLVRIGNAFGNSESEARTVRLPVPSLVRAVEPLKNEREVLGPMPDPVSLTSARTEPLSTLTLASTRFSTGCGRIRACWRLKSKIGLIP